MLPSSLLIMQCKEHYHPNDESFHFCLSLEPYFLALLPLHIFKLF